MYSLEYTLKKRVPYGTFKGSLACFIYGTLLGCYMEPFEGFFAKNPFGTLFSYYVGCNIYPKEPFFYEGSILHTEEPFWFQKTVWITRRTLLSPKNPRVPYGTPKNPFGSKEP